MAFKQFILSLVLVSAVSTVRAQSKFNYSWVSGIFKTYIIVFNGAEMVFSDSTHSINYLSLNGGTNICDSNGNVILMSNGCKVFNKNKVILDNGDSIGGRDYLQYYNGFSLVPQTCLFLPFKDSVYYMPYCTASDTEFDKWMNVSGHDAVFDMMGYCKIDMKLNGGLGKVVEREIPLLQNDTLSKSQMMACKHANGKDWWVLKQARGANKVYKFLFTQDSVDYIGSQNFPEPVFSIFDQGGQSMFSQDGTKYATTCRGTGKVFVADFDRCQGILSNPEVYNIPEQNCHNPLDTTLKETFTEGLAFSPNGQYLYIDMYFNILQLDLLDTDSSTAWYHVAGLDTTWDAFQSYSNMYLAPDNRLYIGNFSNGSKQMSRIDNPDVKGVGCNFCPRCLRMPAAGIVAPPHMPNYDLGIDTSMCWPLENENVNEKENLLSIYPNPARNVLTIESDDLNRRENTVEVYNLLGQVLLSERRKTSSGKIDLDISSLKEGMYLLKIVTRSPQGVNEWVRKLIVE
ncbi:MAG: T9SS type A sorting domain-containing protein [Chitinophagaceae bacterium]|nr:T9SS type A sorting domain-containing protein [Chitinophagaceae bacterium]